VLDYSQKVTSNTKMKSPFEAIMSSKTNMHRWHTSYKENGSGQMTEGGSLTINSLP